MRTRRMVPRRRRLRVLVAALLLATGVTAVGSTTAAAAKPTAVIRPPVAQSGVSADALPTVQVDGVVWSIAATETVAYAGGDFSKARPAGAAPGVNTRPVCRWQTRRRWCHRRGPDLGTLRLSGQPARRSQTVVFAGTIPAGRSVPNAGQGDDRAVERGRERDVGVGDVDDAAERVATDEGQHARHRSAPRSSSRRRAPDRTGGAASAAR